MACFVIFYNIFYTLVLCDVHFICFLVVPQGAFSLSSYTCRYIFTFPGELLGQKIHTFCWQVCQISFQNCTMVVYNLTNSVWKCHFLHLSSQGYSWSFKLLALNRQKTKSSFNFFITQHNIFKKVFSLFCYRLYW